MACKGEGAMNSTDSKHVDHKSESARSDLIEQEETEITEPYNSPFPLFPPVQNVFVFARSELPA
jgi:hypothetical protein